MNATATARTTKGRQVRREIHPELLDREGQAVYRVRIGQMIKDVRTVQAHASALNRMITCSDEFVRPEMIRAEMRALKQAIEASLARDFDTAMSFPG